MPNLKYDKAEIIFSLIMATYNRKEEVLLFIESLLKQDFDLNKIELIIVDQNKNNLLDDIVNKYKCVINLIHIKSEIAGTSLNRNIGIEKASGNIIAFPDDDCTYYSNTLSEVYGIFLDKKITSVLGQVVDKDGNKLIRNWPDQITKIKMSNFFSLYSQITIFTSVKDVFFDVRLGIGSKFGAYEDADYILSLFNKNKDVMYYYPDIKISHPQLNIKTMSPAKVMSYGLGFGGFCKKNKSPLIFILFMKVIAYHFVMMILALLKMDRIDFKKRYFSIISRLQGFLMFN